MPGLKKSGTRKTSDAQVRATLKYEAANIKRYTFKVNKKTEPDIYEKVESVESFNGYLKRLIREDIARNG